MQGIFLLFKGSFLCISSTASFYNIQVKEINPQSAAIRNTASVYHLTHSVRWAKKRNIKTKEFL